MSNIQITIKRWSAWMPGIATEPEWREWVDGQRMPAPGEKPAVQDIPPMLRRRLSPLGKMALSAAWPLLRDEDGEPRSMPSLFCSRHGELGRTVGMLQDLARGQALSPTQFSLSVHNAIGGVFSIARKDRSPITALAVGDEGFSQALLETHLILAEQQCSEALCVVYDEPLPEIYRDFGREPEWPYAFAAVLGTATGESSAVELDLNLHGAGEFSAAQVPPSADTEPQALAFLRFLMRATSRELLLPHGLDYWRWRRIGAKQ